ncbi:MAG TPA: hypothetical protein VNC21_00070 [Vicinamibacterales bacterium]|nr:hypothetical protein [Vicinamibacterales bacterium]
MNTTAPFSFVRTIAAVSGVYDALVGLFLLLAADRFAALFGVQPAQPPIFSDLNGLFLLAVGIGYYWPYADPRGARWYLWIMGPGLKGAGALAFLIDYFVRHSPASFLLFAASDGTLALLTLAALAGSRNTPARPPQ